jgi:DNA-directed RNA polymerase specialized sigma24 family protein
VTTHWSVVLSAKGQDSPQSREALEVLCRTYWRPLYAFVRRRGYGPDDARDLTQDFFAWLLQRDWLDRADRERGRFRSFLLTSIGHFLSNEWDKANAQKRGGGRVIPLDFEVADADSAWHSRENATPEQVFEWRWALALLDRVMDRLADEFARDGRTSLFDALKPCLVGDRSAQPYAALATKLGMTEGSIKVAIHRLRQRYRQLLRDEIGNTVATPQEIDEEMRHLFAVLSAR